MVFNYSKNGIHAKLRELAVPVGIDLDKVLSTVKGFGNSFFQPFVIQPDYHDRYALVMQSDDCVEINLSFSTKPFFSPNYFILPDKARLENKTTMSIGGISKNAPFLNATLDSIIAAFPDSIDLEQRVKNNPSLVSSTDGQIGLFDYSYFFFNQYQKLKSYLTNVREKENKTIISGAIVKTFEYMMEQSLRQYNATMMANSKPALQFDPNQFRLTLIGRVEGEYQSKTYQLSLVYITSSQNLKGFLGTIVSTNADTGCNNCIESKCDLIKSYGGYFINRNGRVFGGRINENKRIYENAFASVPNEHPLSMVFNILNTAYPFTSASAERNTELKQIAQLLYASSILQ